MPLSGTYKKLFWGFAGLGALWACFIGLLLNPWLQRHALYAHKLHSAWWQDLNSPEKWGYMKNQIRPLNIGTPDGEMLYAWHILPPDVYHKWEKQLLEEPKVIQDYKQSLAYKILTATPKSKVAINFHGNAGHVGQGWRTDCYRAISQGSSDMHVIAFDYRGFGYSSGYPTESGLITDGIAAVDWVLETTQIRPDRIVLVAQSLGTAVATAVVETFAVVRQIEFAGLILISPFSDLVKLLSTYAIGRVIPIFSPLAPYPQIQRYLESRVVDTWNTEGRLASFFRNSNSPKLHLIHAKDDFDIHWTHSTKLFYAAANATGLSAHQVGSAQGHVDLDSQGTLYSWRSEGTKGLFKTISYHLLKFGGHNRITTYAILPKTIIEVFDKSP